MDERRFFKMVEMEQHKKHRKHRNESETMHSASNSELIKYYFKLIRIPNLLIIAVNFYLIRWCITYPILKIQKLEFQFSELNYFLFLLSVILTTAAGYIINDYFDRKTDSINRPKEVIIGKYINRRTAIIHHSLFNFIAIILSFYVSASVGMYKLGFISVIATIILWLYSTQFKRMFFVGNFVVASLTALMPILAAIFDIGLLQRKYHSQILNLEYNFSEITFWVIGFTFFAFVLNLMREITKDIEDKDGDKAFGRKTVPIVLGVFYTKTVLLFLQLITIISIIIAYSKYLNDNVSLWYITAFLVLPLVYIIIQTLKAKRKEDYHRISILIKILMMFGMFYSFVILYNNF